MLKLERNTAIIERYQSGVVGMQDIATEFGVTRARVQQILSDYDSTHGARLNRRHFKFSLDKMFAKMCVTETGCWEWTGTRQPLGYGLISMGKGRGMIQVSRLVVMLKTTEPLGRWDFVCHSCDNPPCCNPDHLFVGTSSDNQRDRREKERLRGHDTKGMMRRGCIYIAKLHNNPLCACEFCVRAWCYYRRDNKWMK